MEELRRDIARSAHIAHERGLYHPDDVENFVDTRLQSMYAVEGETLTSQKLVKDPIKFANPSLTEEGKQNAFSLLTKNVIKKLKNVSYKGAKFELIDDVINIPKDPLNLYLKDCRTNSSPPKVKVTIGDKSYEAIVRSDAVNNDPSIRIPYCQIGDVKYYIPNPNNTIRNFIIDFFDLDVENNIKIDIESRDKGRIKRDEKVKKDVARNVKINKTVKKIEEIDRQIVNPFPVEEE